MSTCPKNSFVYVFVCLYFIFKNKWELLYVFSCDLFFCTYKMLYKSFYVNMYISTSFFIILQWLFANLFIYCIIYRVITWTPLEVVVYTNHLYVLC